MRKVTSSELLLSLKIIFKMASEKGFQSRKKRPRFFLCGICNVVSIAENTANERDTTEDTAQRDEEKRLSSTMARNKDTERSLHTDTSESSLNTKHFISRDVEDTGLKALAQTQSSSQMMVSRYGEEVETFRRAEGKICRNECLKKLENFDSDKDGKIIDKDSSDRGLISSKSSQKVPEKENLNCEEISSKGEMASGPSEALPVDGLENEKDNGMQKRNSSPKDLKTFVPVSGHTSESFESTETNFAPENENSTRGSHEKTNVPEIQINGTESKHACHEEEKPLPGSRWKRIVALRTNSGRGKKMQRDSATINEEYELIVSTLKEYGVW